MAIKKVYKNFFSYILISALCITPLDIMALPKTASAEVYMTTSDNKWHYTLNADGSVSIRGMPYETVTEESVEIPASINGKKVTSIGDMAFAHRNYPFKEIVIPSSVVSIGEHAFSGNESLENITLTDSINEIGEYAFYQCSNLKNVRTNGSGTPGGAGNASIGKLSFGSCTNLESISIPAGINYIGTYAFDMCENLRDVSIPDSIQEIGEMAFYLCKSLKNISVPGTAKNIGRSAFLACEGLESVTLGNGVESIGDYAFCGCENLQEVTMPDTISYLGISAYDGCIKLTGISLPAGIKGVNERAFYECKSLKNIDIPDGATYIDKDAFSYCHALESATIPESVTRIGEDAFFLCTPLVIYTPSGSYAETYAYEKNIKLYVTGLDAEESPSPPETLQPPQETPGVQIPAATPEVAQTIAPASTPKVTQTPVPSATPEVTRTPAPSATPSVTQAPAPTATPRVTQTPVPSATPTATPKASQAPVPTATPRFTQTPVPSATPTATPKASQTPVPSATPDTTKKPGTNNTYSFLDTGSSLKIADSLGNFYNNAIFIETSGTGSFTATVEGAGWLRLSDTSKFSFADGKSAITLNGDQNIYLAVSKNTGSKRTATISVVHENQNLVKEITVTQMGKDEAYLYTDIDALYFDEPAAGYSDSFTVLADENTVWTASASKGWIKIVKDSSSKDKKYSSVEGSGNCGLRVFVKENNKKDKDGNYIDRSGYVTVNAGSTGKYKIYIHQAENEKSVRHLIRELSASVPRKNIAKGQTVKIKLDYPDGLYASDISKVTFSSNKKKVASVNSKGVVKGRKKGKAVITVKVTAKDVDYGPVSKSFKIKITVGKRKIDLSKFKNSKKRRVN